ncbi:MAG: methyl-accepting chemotaxis protein [Treponema sp.]|nr:methyl-accepting chemotaxis protein [Treponema sp.]
MFSSIRIRFIAIFTAFVLLSCGIQATLSSLSILNTGVAIAQNQGQLALRKALRIIDGDQFERVAESLDDTDPYYEECRIALLDIAETLNSMYLYTMVPTGRSMVYKYIIDGSCDPSDKENFSPIGTEEDISSYGEAVPEAMRTGQITSGNLEHQDEWGYTVSSYAAIRNSKGKTIGMIGIDFDVSFIRQKIHEEVRTMLLISLLFVIIGLVIITLFTRFLFDTMSKISEEMRKIANGKADLTTKIPYHSKNELGTLAENCNSVIGNMNQLVGSLKQEASVLTGVGETLSDKMTRHITQIEKTANDVADINSRISEQSVKIEHVNTSVRAMEKEITALDDRIIDQTNAIQQSSSAIEQISANISTVDRNVSIIMEQYDTLVAQSDEGRQLLGTVSEELDDISAQSKHLNEANLAIASIAKQTNLLAMNAAIEAAHAGEAGKGFSVVADEIRKLSETSSAQSAAITKLLKGISQAIASIVKSNNDSATAFDGMRNKILMLQNLIQQVQGGMREETAGVKDILQTMKTLDGTTKSILDASSQMKGESAIVFGDITELKKIAESTHGRSEEISGSIDEMLDAAQDAVNAATQSKKASAHVAQMVNGFTV